ncbi:hypothetical protein MMC25_002112 [Agyrium rufum]|nr:hypothetical protein [Agyrium rufum]
MPVELRKRKAPEAPAAVPPTKKPSSTKSAASKAKAAVTGKKENPSNGTSSGGKAVAGSSIELEGFGGEIETNDGNKTSLEKLVDESQSGVVIFTYPKASTPGCTTQACLFRDKFDALTSTGFSIYGLSLDSAKSNTTFKTKQNLPYTLLCDPSATLISAIGMKKAPKSTTRGVFIVNKAGKVLAMEPGGPAATVKVVEDLIAKEGEPEVEKAGKAQDVNGGLSSATNGKNHSETEPPTPSVADTANGKTEPTTEDVAKATVAADVADTAEMIDGGD